MGKKKRVKKNTLQPIKQPLKPLVYITVSAGGLFLGIALLILYIFKAPDLLNRGIDKPVFYVLLIPLGFSAAAFLFGGMRSYALYTGKVFSGKLQIMGPAVVFLLVIVLGFILIPTAMPFEFTIFLKDSEGKAVLKKDQALVRLKLDNNAVTGQTDDNGGVDFKGIHPKFMNSDVHVELEAMGWEFTTGKTSTTFKLEGNNAVLIIQRDDSLSVLSGIVMDSNGHFIADAKVVIKDLVTSTNENGWFMLKIPLVKQEEKQILTVTKEGYQPYMDYVYPGNPTKLVIALKREKKP